MTRAFEFAVIATYNLALLAGASYLVYYKDASAWIFALALLFGASWNSDKKEEVK